jgi:hypothetical protein
MPFAPPPPSGAQQWTPPAGTSSNRRRFLPVGIGIVVIVAIRILMSGALFSNSGPDSVTLAPSVNGLPQITSGQPATTAQQMKTSMESSNVTGGDAAAYGTGPDATFYALVGPGTPDAQQNYDDAKSGLAGSATFGPQTSQDVGGLTLLCSDLTYSSGTTGALCVWDQDFQGIVISKGPGMTQTAQFGAAVHDSIQ